MTAIGKIFVIINLLFSLFVAALIVMVYARSTNWKASYEAADANVKAATASLAALNKELNDEKVAAATRLGDKDKAIADRDTKLAAAEKQAKLDQEALGKFRENDNSKQFSYEGLKTELEKRKTEVVGLEDQIKTKDQEIVKYIELKNVANDAKVAAEIKANSFQAKAERLEARVRETEVEIVKLRRTGGSGSGAAGGVALVSTANPPPQSVEGIVTELTGRGDLIRISIGSDAGLEKGHTLDVYRLKPTPQYLGQVRLTDVRANESVAVPVDKLKGPVQKGDLVANEVMSKK